MRYKLRSVDELRICGPPEMADLASSQYRGRLCFASLSAA